MEDSALPVFWKYALLAPLLCTPGLARDGRPPLLIFREPDRRTAREIDHELVDPKGIGSSTRAKRTEARARLIEIGAWTVPFLSRAVAEGDGVRIPMNAIMVLARIGDPQCLPKLRLAAERNRDPYIRQTACLSIGLFRDAHDSALLQRLLLDEDHKRRQQRAAALALAKLRTAEGGIVLLATVHDLPRETHEAAAVVLAAAIATPQFDATALLDHEERLVRRAALTALLIRPLHADEIGKLVARMRRPEDKRLRDLQYDALSAVKARDESIRKRLLDCATKTREKSGARIAALLGLAAEWNVTSSYPPLKSLFRGLQGRNDPVFGALQLALLSTGEPKAVDDLLRLLQGSDRNEGCAVGILLDFLVQRDVDDATRDRILDRVERRRGRTKDALLLRLMDLARTLRDPALSPTEAREKVRTGLREIVDPYGLHLWDRTPEERRWARINDLLGQIFELDDLPDYGDPLSRAKTPVAGHGGGGQQGKSGKPEEQDLLDFLREKAYFGPEDLRAPGDGGKDD